MSAIVQGNVRLQIRFGRLSASINGRTLLKINELVAQTAFASPTILALATINTSTCRVLEVSVILFSKSPHEICCSPHPASRSGKMTRQGIARNLRMVPSGLQSRIFPKIARCEHAAHSGLARYAPLASAVAKYVRGLSGWHG